MQKIKAIIALSLSILLIIPICLPLVLSAEGNIRINSKTVSTLNQQIQAGSNVNLYFGEVTWSGTQMYLLLSYDNVQQISTGDMVYTPKFALSDLTNPLARTTYSNGNGAWVVGNNWINGTITQNIPVGKYYIKAFDEAAATVAVTDTSIVVYSVVYSATLQATPASGAGGINAKFTGSGFPPSSPVTISYHDPTFGSWNYLTTATADNTGKIEFTTEVPDLKKSAGSGDNTESYSQVSYRAEINGIVYCYYDYNQYARGLKQVGNQIANGLYGNGTNLASTVNIKAGDTLTLSGKYFHPGVIYVRWDGHSVVGTVTGDQWRNAAIVGTTVANGAGSFQTTITVPSASAGEHYLSIEDSQTRVIIKIYVSLATLNISPSSGPGGATVQFTGSGYPASAPITISYRDPQFNTWNILGTTTSDAAGTIQHNTEVPDLRQSIRGYDTPETTTAISFRTEQGSIIYGYADYNEQHRGLKQVGNQIANGLYGNGTNLASTVNIKAGDTLTLSGKYFHPGVIYVRWDGHSVVGTVTGDQWRNAAIVGTTVANGAGSFQTTITVPSASAGEHYLSIEDSQTRVIIKVKVIQTTPTPSPTPTPTPKDNAIIEVNCRSTTNYIGYQVEINGKLTSNTAAPITAAPILLSYSINGSDTWQGLTLVYTDSNGEFTAVWMPHTSGNYLIKATWEGNDDYNHSSKIVSFASAPYAQQNVFSVTSNSTVSALAFDLAKNQLSFSVSGPTGTTGYVDISIAKSIAPDITNIQVYVDDEELQYTTTSTTNAWLLHFQYTHSSHKVVVNIGQDSTQTPSPTNTLTPTPTPTSITPTPTVSPILSPEPSTTSMPNPTPELTATPSESPIAQPSPTIPELPTIMILLIIIILSAIIGISLKKGINA